MKQPHIQLDESIACKYAILPGDPKRLDAIAKQLENVQELAYNREYRSLKGTYKGIEILALSTGIGGASTCIAVEEMARIGIKGMIRIGSCGALQEGIGLGDLIIAEGAVRKDGVGLVYVDQAYPAVSNLDLVYLCREVARENKLNHRVGLVHSHESFYVDDYDKIEEYWSEKGILGSDMESGPLLTIGRLRHVACASILNNVVIYHEKTDDSISDYVSGDSLCAKGEHDEIAVALEAFYRYDKEIL